MSSKPLYPYQEAAIAKWLARPDRRLIWAHSTGAGKSRAALQAARLIHANRMLIVGSAMARPTWVREAERWKFEHVMHSVRYGRANKSLTKKQVAERDTAYGAAFQTISYSLLKHIDAGPRDLVVFDEAHRLKSPTSQQSRIAKAYMRAHPTVPALLLTATPIPNEVQDIWNLVDTLFPGYLGEETDTGEVAWGFRRAYCQRQESEYGVRYYGSNAAALPRLAKKLEPIMHRVSSEEVAQYAPALNASLLWIDEPRIKDADIAEEWLEDREADGSTHVGLFAWEHATAHKLADAARERGWPVTIITGLMHPEQRQNMLDHCAQAPRMCVVGTAGSLAESISLSFLRQALVFEWQATPGQALQFAGRFARPDSKTSLPTFLQYVARTDDEAQAKVLRTRLDAVAALYDQDSRSKTIQELMAPRKLDDQRLQTLADAMFSEARVSLGGFSDEGEQDE